MIWCTSPRNAFASSSQRRTDSSSSPRACSSETRGLAAWRRTTPPRARCAPSERSWQETYGRTSAAAAARGSRAARAARRAVTAPPRASWRGTRGRAAGGVGREGELEGAGPGADGREPLAHRVGAIERHAGRRAQRAAGGVAREPLLLHGGEVVGAQARLPLHRVGAAGGVPREGDVRAQRAQLLGVAAHRLAVLAQLLGELLPGRGVRVDVAAVPLDPGLRAVDGGVERADEEAGPERGGAHLVHPPPRPREPLVDGALRAGQPGQAGLEGEAGGAGA